MHSLEHIPSPGERRIAVRLKPAAERAIRCGHPWVFDQSIRRQSHEGRSGDLAVVFDTRDRFLAIGLYDPHSPIRVRVLQYGQPATINSEWFAQRLAQALQVRHGLPQSGTTGYRLVHGENDGLPGLVLDRYDEALVLRLDTAAWLPHLTQFLPVLLDQVPCRHVVLRMSRKTQGTPSALHGLLEGQLLHGGPLGDPVRFQENHLWFEADLVHGQKTGFFLDQRDNRARVEALLLADETLKSVLNVFAYTGAFAVYAARAGARRIVNVDAGEAALAGADRNLQLNSDRWPGAPPDHLALVGDAFEIMDSLVHEQQRFDVVVIDPPSFAKNSQDVALAMTAYRRLARVGLALTRPDGLFVMASCSSRIQADAFFNMLAQTARQAGRPLRELARTGHPLDHPVGFPEGAYLKCLFARVPAG